MGFLPVVVAGIEIGLPLQTQSSGGPSISTPRVGDWVSKLPTPATFGLRTSEASNWLICFRRPVEDLPLKPPCHCAEISLLWTRRSLITFGDKPLGRRQGVASSKGGVDFQLFARPRRITLRIASAAPPLRVATIPRDLELKTDWVEEGSSLVEGIKKWITYSRKSAFKVRNFPVIYSF